MYLASGSFLNYGSGLKGKVGIKNTDSLTRIASRCARRLYVSTMDPCSSIAAPSFVDDSLNSSRRRQNDVLPYEILRAIFLYISHGHILHLRHLLFVCRLWSVVILQEAGLWSTIRIDYELYQHFGESRPGTWFTYARAENFVSLCVSRSRSHPLSIILDFSPFRTWSHVGILSIRWEVVPLLVTLVGRLHEHALRWHSLEWNSLFHVSEIISILPPRLPQLKYLRMHSFEWDRGNELIFPRCPNLEVVELHEHRKYKRQLFSERDSPNVKELLVESRWNWCLEDLRYIASFRNVLRLTLSSSLSGAYFEIKAPEKIHLPQLKDLWLKGRIHLNVVGLLSAPSLNRVEFDHSESINSILSHLVSSNIETITALIPPPTSVASRVTIAAAIAHLVTSLHGLRLLRVKRWIHDVMNASDCTSGILGHVIRLSIEA